jgi:glyoxylase-like metal-dependent hydrolase (beta-lactamase superfamily II)
MITLVDGAVLAWSRPMLGFMTLTGYALKTDSGDVVLVDPPDPGDGLNTLERFGRPTHIFVTFRDHDRAVVKLADHFGARIWIPKGTGETSVARFDEEYDEQSALPGGLKALSMPAVGYGEHALYGTVRGKKVAFIGDAVFNDERLPWPVDKFILPRNRGQLRRKASYRGGNTPEAMVQVRKLLDLDLDAALFSHGQPVGENARAVLKESIESW